MSNSRQHNQQNGRQFKPHLAGQKIKAWRKARDMSAEQFGVELGQPAPWLSRTVYGWETLGKTPRSPQIVQRLQRLGICDAEDWFSEPVPAADAGQEAA